MRRLIRPRLVSRRRRVASSSWQSFLATCGRVEALESRCLLSGTNALDVSALWFEAASGTDQAVDRVGFASGLETATAADLLAESRAARGSDWIVRLKPKAIAGLSTVAAAQQIFATIDVAFEVVRGLGLPGLVLVRTSESDARRVNAALAGNSQIAYFEFDASITAQTVPNDPLFVQQVGLNSTGQNGAAVDADIDAPEAWSVTTGSSSVVVAVIDSGMELSHPDLAANLWVNPGEIAGNGQDDDHNGFVDDVNGYDFFQNDTQPLDQHGHGTHVAGTIGAVGNNGVGVTGVAWSTKLMPLRFLGPDNTGAISDAIRAINYATMMKTQHGVNVRVANNSWGTQGEFARSTALQDAINAQEAADILFVAAAGNGNVLGFGIDVEQQPFYPASYTNQNILSVAATGQLDEKARFSNYGATSIDIAAPGIGVLSTAPLSQGSYVVRHGTSMATAAVSGVAALLFANRPDASAAEVKNALMSSVDVLPSLAGKVVSGGRVNAARALQEDAFAPRPTLTTANNVTSTGATSHTIAVQYVDNVLVNVSTLNSTDLVIEGPTGQQLPVTFTTSTPGTNSNSVLATYSLTPPGGAWDSTDNGIYQVRLMSGQVADTDGNITLGQLLGSFTVNIDFTPPFQVNSTADTVDANPGNRTAADSNGATTLRAAIMEANALAGLDTILLPAGTIALTRAGANEDLAATGDLDITQSVNIVGAGVGLTIIDAASLDRVFQVSSGVTVNLSKVTLRGGSASGGGAIRNAGTVVLDQVLIANNASTAGGGGIFNSGTLTVTNSTIATNTAATSGAGVQNSNGTVTLSNSTVSGNTATQSGGGLQNNFAGSVFLTNVTLTNNSAGTTGGGVDNAGSVRPTNSILAGNTATTSDPDVKGTFNSQGTNLIGIVASATGFTGTKNDLIGTSGTPINPSLGPLQNNGGATPTHAPQALSPAIDRGNDVLAPTLDQTGRTRPVDGDAIVGAVSDIGSVEYIATGQIRGRKFHDLNRNGQQDSNEPGLAGWTIFLDTDNDGQLDGGEVSTVTIADNVATTAIDEAGQFVFSNLTPGTYTVAEVMQSGWQQTAPNGGNSIPSVFSMDADMTYGVDITTDGVNGFFVSGVNLNGSGFDAQAIFQIPFAGGEASVFAGAHNPNELTTDGQFVYWIDPNGDPDATAIFRKAISGGSVEKVFSGFATGQPIVDGSGIDFVGGSGSPGQLVTNDQVQGRIHRMTAGSTVSNITQLGTRYGGFFDQEHYSTIDESGGVIYIADSGRDGTNTPMIQSIPVNGSSFTTLFQGTFASFSPGGIAVDGNTIYITNRDRILKLPTSGLANGAQPELVVTDARFKNLRGLTVFNGAIYVVDNDSSAQRATIWKVPLSGTYSVTVAAGDVALAKDFGNVALPGEIKGRKFRDDDGDGVQDAPEPGLANWTIFLDTNANGQLDDGEPAQQTNAQGDYDFKDLDPLKSYTIAEVQQIGWQQTYPLTPFTSSVTNAIGTPSSVEQMRAGDFNGDGIPELIAAGSSARIYRNDGSGVFSASNSVTLASQGGALDVGDVDGDGDLDVVITERFSDSIRVYRNQGDFNFTSMAYAVGDDPFAVRFADFDDDGDLDVVAANKLDSTITLRFNTGFGAFGSPTTLNVGASPETVEVGDLDQDGHSDILVGRITDSGVNLFYGNGDGTFASTTLQAGGQSLAVRITDLTGDTLPDVVIADISANTLKLFRNTGSRQFAAAVTTNVTNTNRITTADMDGDGDEDVVMARRSTPEAFSVLLNLGTGAFSSPIDFPVGRPGGLSSASYPVVADFDRNGTPDVAVNFFFETEISVARLARGAQSHSLTLSPAQIASGFNFGNRPLPGRISGQKFNDADGDGVKDPDEPGLPGFTIFLDTNSNGVREVGEPFTVTKADGSYSFTNLAPFQSYFVTEEQQAGFTQTAPVSDGAGGLVTVTQFSSDPDITYGTDITTDGVHGFFVSGVDPSGTGFNAQEIFQIPLTGGDATVFSAANNPNGLTTDGQYVYWIDPNGDPDATAIFRRAINGGVSEKVFSGFATGQPIVDGSDIDFVAGSGSPGQFVTNDQVQGRIHTLTGGSTVSNITQLGTRYGGFFDREHFSSVDESNGVIYIADSGRDGTDAPLIQSIPVSGGSFTTLFTGEFASFSPGGIVVNGNTIYVSSRDRIFSLPTAGLTGNQQPQLVVADPRFKNLRGLTFLNGALYVLDNDSQQQRTTVWKVTPNASEVTATGAWVVQIDPGKFVTNRDFGNQRDDQIAGGESATAKIVGQVYEDQNGNGLKEESEPGVPGVAMFLDLNRSGTLDSGEPTTFTLTDDPVTTDENETGFYVFADLVSGPFSVREVVPSGYQLTAPQTVGFSATELQSGDRPAAVATGDIDGDGDLDLVAANSGTNTVSVFKNRGDGTFLAPTTFIVGNSPADVVLARLDGDADLDLAVSNAFSSTVSVLKNDGLGNFATATSFGVGTTPFKLVAGDLDGDNDMDLATTNEFSNSVTVLLNNGSASFPTRRDVSVGSSPEGLVVADIDGDTDRDLVTVNFEGTYTRLFNDGAANFTTQTAAVPGDGAFAITAADVDFDTDIDLAIANVLSDDVTVLVNDSSGNYSAVGPFSAGRGPAAITAADVNNDSVVDLIVTSGQSSSITILYRVTAPNFGAATSFGVANLPSILAFSVLAADFDNDGDNDIAVANGTANTVAVLENVPTVGSFNATLFEDQLFFGADFGNRRVAQAAQDSQSGAVSITLVGDASLSIASVSGTIAVTINGQLDSSFNLPTASVTAITVVGGADKNFIDLSAVSAATFTHVGGVVVNISGGDGEDTILGSGFADTILGDGGNDSISGCDGNDEIHGVLGRDTLIGNNGADSLFGEGNEDVLTGSAGADVLSAGAGIADLLIEEADASFVLSNSQLRVTVGAVLEIDTISGFERAWLTGGSSSNLINASAFTGSLGVMLNGGGTGTDTLIGSPARDTITGGIGNDSIVGNAGNDVLTGGSGRDTISGGLGNDSITGSAGNDVLFGNEDIDTIFGGSGNDTIDGGAGNDVANGQDNDDSLLGGDGNDTISGSTGNDFLDGGLNDDSLTGDAGFDTLFGRDGADLLVGGDDNDRLEGEAGADRLRGEKGLDTLLGGAGADNIFGGADNDSIDGGDDNDSLFGDFGDDTVRGGNGDDQLRGHAGQDLIDGGAGTGDKLSEDGDTNFVITGTRIVSALYGDETPINIERFNLSGGAGNNLIDGRLASVKLLLNGMDGNDTLLGGALIDNILGGEGDDVLSGGASNDIIDGGVGNDSFYEKSDANVTINGLQVVSTTTGTETLVGIERIALVGGDSANKLDAALASLPVILIGGKGNDTLIGGNFNDVLIGGSRTVNPQSPGGDGTDSLTGGAGTDSYDDDQLDTRSALEANETATTIAAIFAAGLSPFSSWLDVL